MAFQRFIKTEEDCFNKRNLHYMCEVNPHKLSWTLENGLCWPDNGYDDERCPPWNINHQSNLTDDEKCQYLFRCVLSNNFENDCPCIYLNCTELMINLCPESDHLILYPPKGLIDANIIIMYNYSHSMEIPTFQLLLLSEGRKCRGYYFHAKQMIEVRIEYYG